jgi:hypothetical protein
MTSRLWDLRGGRGRGGQKVGTSWAHFGSQFSGDFCLFGRKGRFIRLLEAGALFLGLNLMLWLKEVPGQVFSHAAESPQVHM